MVILQRVADITTPQIQDLMKYDDFLPRWDTQQIDLKQAYESCSLPLPFTGYAAASPAIGPSRSERDSWFPVKNADPQSIDQLYGYSRERNQVLENTRALAEGRPASNVLLYGDAGTGKVLHHQSLRQRVFLIRASA